MNKEIKLTKIQQEKFVKLTNIKQQLQLELQKINEQEQDLLDILFEMNEIQINKVKNVEFSKGIIILHEK